MSVNLPPELGWVARLAVGQAWPKGDEDKMHSLGLAWDEAAQALAAISREVSPATRGVLNSIGGSVADEFASFVKQLQSNLPDMAEASSQLGKLGRNTGAQLEYAKYMILAQLVWLAFEIAQMAFWAPEAIPALITSARLVVQMLLRRLLTAIATGVGMMLGMDAIIQSIQMLKGDRTHWSVENTVAAIESGAIGGAIGGLTFGLGGAFFPKFGNSLFGKGILGGISGVGSTAALGGLFNSGEPEDLGFGGAAGAIGGMAGGGGRRRFGGGDKTKVDDFNFHLPSTLDLPNLHGPAEGPGGFGGHGAGFGSDKGFGPGGGFTAGKGGGTGTGGGTGRGVGSGGGTGRGSGGSGGAPRAAGGGPVRTTGGDGRTTGATSGARPPVESSGGHGPVAEQSFPPPVTSRAAGNGSSTFAPRSAPPAAFAEAPANAGEGRSAPPGGHQGAPASGELPGFSTAFPSAADRAPTGTGAAGGDRGFSSGTDRAPTSTGAAAPRASTDAPPVRVSSGTGGTGDGAAQHTAAPGPQTTRTAGGGQAQAPAPVRSAQTGSGGVTHAPPPVRAESGPTSTAPAASGRGTGPAAPVHSTAGQGGASHATPSEVAPRAPRPPTTVTDHSATAPGPSTVDGASAHTPPEVQTRAPSPEPVVVDSSASGGGSVHTPPEVQTRAPSPEPVVVDSSASGGGSVHTPPEVQTHAPGVSSAPSPVASGGSGGTHAGTGGESVHTLPDVPTHRPGGEPAPIESATLGGVGGAGGGGPAHVLPDAPTRAPAAGPGLGGSGRATEPVAAGGSGGGPARTVSETPAPASSPAPVVPTRSAAPTAPGDGPAHAFPDVPTHTPGGEPAPAVPAASGGGTGGAHGGTGGGAPAHVFPDVPTHVPGDGPAPGAAAHGPGDGPAAVAVPGGGGRGVDGLEGLSVPDHPVGDTGGSAHPVHDAPDAPTAPPVSPFAHVGPRVDALDRAGQAAGMTPSERQGYRQAVDQAARSGNLNETTRQLQAFREHVDTRALNQRYDAFRQHADGGFGATRAPQSQRSTWDNLVDAVEQARRGGDPDLLDSHLREYTDFVEQHAPSEVLTGHDAPQPYHPDMENVRRQLATATGPDADRLRSQLADLQQTADLGDRLNQLNNRPGGPDPQEAALIRAVDRADSPQAAARALEQLQDHRADQALQQRIDQLNSDHVPEPGGGRNTPDDLGTRLDGLRGDTDPHEQALLQQIDHASTPDEAARAIDALHDYRDQQNLRNLQQRLDQLDSGPDEHSGGRQDLPTDDELHSRLTALGDGDPVANNLRQQAYDAHSPQDAQRALDELAAHEQQVRQQRQDEANRLSQELDQAEQQHTRDLLSGRQDAAARSARAAADLRDQLDHAMPHDQHASDLRQELGRGLGGPHGQQDPGHLGRIGAGPNPAATHETPAGSGDTHTQPRPQPVAGGGTSHDAPVQRPQPVAEGSTSHTSPHGSPVDTSHADTPVRQPRTDGGDGSAPVRPASHSGTDRIPLQEGAEPSEQQARPATVPPEDSGIRPAEDPAHSPVPDTSGLDELLHRPPAEGGHTPVDEHVPTDEHVSGDERVSGNEHVPGEGEHTPVDTHTSAVPHTPASEHTPAVPHTPASEHTPVDQHAPAVQHSPASDHTTVAPPPARLNHAPRFVVRSSFDQRRFTVGDQTYTDLTVKVALHPGDADPHSVADTRNRVNEGVQRYFNDPGYRLPNGDRLHITVEHVAPGEQAHLNVQLTRGDGEGGGHTDQRTWPAGAAPITYAHEIGHQIGLRDEYRGADDEQGPSVTGGLMGNYHVPSEHGLPQGGLGDRHLTLLGALTGTGAEDAPHPGAGTSTAAAPRPATGSGSRGDVADDPAWQAARSQITPTPRSHVHVDPVTDPLAEPSTTPRPPSTETAPPPVEHEPATTPVETPITQEQQHEPATVPAETPPPPVEHEPATPPVDTPAPHEEQHQTVPAPAETPAPHDPHEEQHEPATTPAETPAPHEEQTTSTPPEAETHTSEPAAETHSHTHTPEPEPEPVVTTSEPGTTGTGTETTGRPEGDPAPQLTDNWHNSSLAGKRITEAPGPEAVRQHVESLLGDKANDPLVVQRLNGQFDPANFRKQYPRMINGGWRFPIHVDGHPYEVRVGADTTPWQLDPTRDAGKDNDGDGLDVKSGNEFAPPKVKTELSTSQSGLDHNPLLIQPVNPDLLVLVTGSAKAGGASHGVETTSSTSAKSGDEVKLTGKTDSYTSQATFDIQVVDHKGQPLTAPAPDGTATRPAPAPAPPITGQLRADVPRSGPRPETGPQSWQGWNPPATADTATTTGAPATAGGAHPATGTGTAPRTGTAPAAGHPLTVTGLGGVRDAVFDALPKDAQPGGTAHQDIVDFLDPDHVTEEFEQVSGNGLVSKPLRLSDGGTGFLRLTAEPGTSTVLHSTDTTTGSGFTAGGEQARNHSQSSGWALGVGGGASGQVWHNPATKETKWLTGTGSYTYGQSTAHGAKGVQSVEESRTTEHKGPADVVSTPTRFRVWLTRQQLSPGTDGLHSTTTEEITDHTPPPAPAPGTHVVQIEPPRRAPTGEVVRVLPRPPEPSAGTEHALATHAPATHPPTTDAPATHAPATHAPATHTSDTDATPAPATTPATATATPPPAVRQPPAGGQLTGPGLVQRTTYSRFPGSEQLEQHIVRTLWQTAPGLLPPPHAVHPPQGGTAGGHQPVRVSPKAFTNLADLRRQIAPSQLDGNGHKLVDGTFKISLDSSHLPGLNAKTHDILVRANLGDGAHQGAHPATAKNSLTQSAGSERSVSQGSSHTVAGNGNLRSSLDHTDFQRGFFNFNADGGYAPTHGTTIGDTTEVKRTLTVDGDRDRYSYPVSFDVLTVRQDPDHPVLRVPTLPTEVHHQQVQHVDTGGGHVTVDVGRTETPAAPPPRQVTVDRLPDHHLVEHVGDEDAYRDHARQAIENAFNTRHDNGHSPLPAHIPSLDDLVNPLAGQAQLRANVSASHGGWSNTADQHVGSGRNRDTAGLSQRTQLHNLTYRETLSGDGKLDVETKTESSVKVQDSTAITGKGGLGGDFGRFPGTPHDPHASTYQLRGGGKGKGSYGHSGADAVKHTFTTSRKTSQNGPWHVYEGDARITLQGRVTGSTGETTYGAPVSHDHRVRVLLSDDDVRAMSQPPRPATGTDTGTGTRTGTDTGTGTDTRTGTGTGTGTGTDTAQPPRRSVPLENGVSGGSRIEIPSTDEILKEIDRQIRGGSVPPGDLEAGNGLGDVPVSALPFADVITPDHLGAHYDDLVGPGLLVHKVDNYHGVRTVTQALIKATPGGWQHDGRQSDGGSTRKVTVSEAVSGDSGRSWSAGGEGNIRASYRAPTAENHLNNVTYNATGGAEAKGSTTHSSSQTTKVDSKTTSSGNLHKFSSPMRFDVTVTRRNATQRFVNLPAPVPVRPDWRATAWVPESMTTTEPAAPAHPQTTGGTTTTTSTTTHPPGTQPAPGTQHQPSAQPGPSTQHPPGTQPGPGTQHQPSAQPGPSTQHQPGDPGGGTELGPVNGTPEQRQQWRDDFASGHDLVGVDHPEQLIDTAHTVLNTPRPWGNGVLGRTGSAMSQAWNATSGALGSAARSMTPDAARAVVDSFVHDPRLGPGHQLHTEQTAPLPQQISTRQALSGQALSTVFPNLKDPAGGYRTVPLGADGSTGLKVTMEPTGPAQEVGRRDDAKDEITVSTEDELTTSAKAGASYSVTPADVQFLTRNPGVVVPVPGLNSMQISRDQSLNADSAVTHAPGVPGRSPAPVTVPHGLTGDKPGQGTTEGVQRLLRQPVRITVQKYDGNGVYGAPASTDHHAYYWSTAPQQPAETPAGTTAPGTTTTTPAETPAPATTTTPAETPAETPAGTAPETVTSTTTLTPPVPAIHVTPPPETPVTPVPPPAAHVAPPSAVHVPPPAAVHVPPPAAVHVPPPAAHVSPPPAVHVPPPAAVHVPPPAAVHVPPPAAPVVQHMPAGGEETAGPGQLTDAQRAWVAGSAQQAAAGIAAAVAGGGPVPVVRIEGSAVVSVDGVPHFGRSLQLADDRARRVAAVYGAALTAAMDELRASGHQVPPDRDVLVTFGPSVPWPPAPGAHAPGGEVTVVLAPPRPATA